MPLLERQLAEDFLGPSAVGAGGLDEHDHLPRLDLAVHELRAISTVIYVKGPFLPS